jgi:hypothetical protein
LLGNLQIVRELRIYSIRCLSDALIENVTKPPVHLRLIRQVHRRWVLWRAVESAAIGIAVGAGVAFVLLPMALWQQRPMMNGSIIMLFIGGIAGFIWGLTRRPTVVETAMRIDQQLGLHDLLSTVLRPGKFMDQQFATILAAQADAECARRGANELIVRRLGGRAWGGIGIVTAMLLTISLLASQPPESVASTAAEAGADRQASTLSRMKDSFELPRQSPLQLQADPATPADRLKSSDYDDQASADPNRFSEPDTSRSRASSGSSADGSGTAAGRTAEARVPNMTPQGTARSEQSSDGNSAPGTSTTPKPFPDGATAAGGGEASPQAARTIAPAQLGTNASAGRLLERRLGDDPTLSAYRDMIRDYFDISGQ